MGVVGGWNKRHDPPGMKWCPKCKSLVAHAAYNRSRNGHNGFGACCNACKAALQRSRREAARQRQGIAPATIARFMSQLDKNGPNGCWLWLGHKTLDGYGTYELNGNGTSAHRVALLVTGITIPDEMYVDHICRTRSCCNPEHLRIVTRTVSALENNESPHARNARKTHCIYGHAFDAENTHICKNGGRQCIACYRARRPNAKVIFGKPVSRTSEERKNG